MQNPYIYENSKGGKELQNQMEIQENYMNHNQQKYQRRRFGHDEGVSSLYANLEIIGNNDEQQLCNANKMDPKSKLCVFGGLILFFFAFE